MLRTPVYLSAALCASASPLAGQADLTPGFEPGPAPEMDHLAFLVGRWQVRPEFAAPAGSGWTATRVAETSFAPRLGGAFLESELAVTWPDGQVWRTISLWSYDRFRREYRVAFLDDLWGLLDVYEGAFEDGALRVDNGRARTWGPQNGPPAMARVVIRDIAPDSFVLEWEGSPADSPAWAPAGLRWVYSRIR